MHAAGLDPGRGGFDEQDWRRGTLAAADRVARASLPLFIRQHEAVLVAGGQGGCDRRRDINLIPVVRRGARLHIHIEAAAQAEGDVGDVGAVIGPGLAGPGEEVVCLAFRPGPGPANRGNAH